MRQATETISERLDRFNGKPNHGNECQCADCEPFNVKNTATGKAVQHQQQQETVAATLRETPATTGTEIGDAWGSGFGIDRLGLHRDTPTTGVHTATQAPSHTPTPWIVGGHPRDNSGSNWREILTTTGMFSPAYVGQALAADAAFIVQAVNSHDRLVAALKASLAMFKGSDREHALVNYPHETELTISDLIRAALNAAEKESNK